MSKIISFISGKGGVGTSFVASTFAMSLSSGGSKCLLIDYAFLSRSDDIFLNLTSRVLYNISDVLEGKCNIKDAIVLSDDSALPDFMASSPQMYPEDCRVNFKKAIREIAAEYDYIIFDVNTLSANGFDVCVNLSDKFIAVTTEDYLSVRNTALYVRRIKDIKDSANIYLDINMVRSVSDASGISAESIADEVGVSLIGITPYENIDLLFSEKNTPPIRTDTDFFEEVKNMCIRLSGGSAPLSKKFTGKKFFGRFK